MNNMTHNMTGRHSIFLCAGLLFAGVLQAADPGPWYRDRSEYLFQPSPFASMTSRIGGNLVNAGYECWYGPTHLFVGRHGDWNWDHPGGDWLDADLVRQGANAWASVPTPSVAPDAEMSDQALVHLMDVTSALRFVQEQQRWCAFQLRGSAAPRVMAAPFHPDPGQRPRLEVIYQDGTATVLACRILAYTSANSASPNSCQPTILIPTAGEESGLFIEFDRPAKAVLSASFRFVITQQWWFGSPTDIRLLGVLDPPVRAAPTIGGFAGSAGTLDEGLAARSGVIFCHRYVDGAPQADFISPGYYNLHDNDFSPELFGGARDTTKLPYVYQGLWINANGTREPPPYNNENLSKVESTYVGEGFQPLAPGLGAVRTHAPAHRWLDGSLVRDGDYTGTMGTLLCQARLMLPIERIGVQQHIRVRYYQRMHITPGESPMTPLNRRQIWNDPDTTPVRRSRFTDRSGKGGIGVSHDTTSGGFSGSSGGPYGWQLRDTWNMCDANLGGPEEGGASFGWHLYDFQFNNPIGHQYGGADYGSGERYGQRGGYGGLLQHDRWYCIEKEIRLNTVRDGTGGIVSGGFLADGYLRTWIDGVLAYERTGMVFRSLPTLAPGQTPGGVTTTPIRDLGVRDLLLNAFHGGQTLTDMDITLFYAGLVVADGAAGYIGPMNGAGGDQSPSTPMDINAAADLVVESAGPGTAVGLTVRSTDPEGLTVAYGLADSAGGRFAIDPATGVVTVAAALDYETAVSHVIRVTASDGTLTAQADFTILVGDVDEGGSAPPTSGGGGCGLGSLGAALAGLLTAMACLRRTRR